MDQRREIVDRVVARLRAAGCVAAEDEAALLISGAADERVLAAWIGRREQGEPLAWILGTTTFCGRRIHVDEGVYVPRPQTEDLARRAVGLFPDGGLAVDLCTGSGAVATHLAVARPSATVIGTDVDGRSVGCARRNGVVAVLADLAAPFRSATADVVTAVAPYVPTGALGLLPADVGRHEPLVALDGGVDGLDVVRRVVADAERVLRPGGWLLIEIGGVQADVLAPSLAGFDEVSVWWDADGDLRGLSARRLGPRVGERQRTTDRT
ncbi:MAG: N5-glutamine methyltransferase family protein [Acidimicrobiales bacterium]